MKSFIQAFPSVAAIKDRVKTANKQSQRHQEMKNKGTVQDRYQCLKGYFLVLGELIEHGLDKVVNKDQPRVPIETRSPRDEGWQKLRKGTKVLRRKDWTPTKIPNIHYLVAISRFVAIYAHVIGQELPYFMMVYIAFYTKLNLQLFNYAQKRSTHMSQKQQISA